MIGTLILKQIMLHTRETRYVIVLAFVCLLVPLSIYVGCRRYTDELEHHLRVVQMNKEGSPLHQESVNVKAMGFRAPHVLSVFARGLGAGIPVAVEISREEGIEYRYEAGDDDVGGGLVGGIDYLFVIGVIGSLLAIVLSFDSVAGEREAGTLKLIVSNPVRRRDVIIAKFLGGATTLLVPFVVAFLAGMLIGYIVVGSVLFSSENLLRILMVFGVSVLFLFAFHNLGVFMSCITRSSIVALLGALLAWALLVFCIPRVGGLLAEVIRPVDSEQMVELKKKSIRRAISDERSEELKEIWTDADYVSLRTPIVERYSQLQEERLRRLEASHEAEKLGQRRLALLIARLSPLSAYANSVTELGNTGITELSSFKRQAKAFRAVVDEQIYTKGYKDQIPEYGMQMSFEWISVDDIPDFNYSSPSLAATVETIGADVVELVIANLLLLGAAVVAFMRYDIR